MLAAVPDSGSDAVKTPLDGRTRNADVSGDDGVARDAANDAAGPEVGSVDAPTTRNEIARACAMAASCSAFASPASTSHCLQAFGRTASRQDDTQFDRLLKCWRTTMVSAVGGCGTFMQGWGGDLFTWDSEVLGGSCSGKEILFTPSGLSSPLRFDGAVMGQECLDPGTDLPRAGCALPSCLGAAGAAPSCDGAVASMCSGHGPRPKVDCGRSGRTCQLSGQNALCVGTGAACDSTEKVSCSGSQATYCAGGARATVDCATNTVATRCAAGASSSEPCAVAGAACNPATFVDVCDGGGGMQVCVDGSVATIPCWDIGLVSCLTPSGTSFARCQEGV